MNTELITLSNLCQKREEYLLLTIDELIAICEARGILEIDGLTKDDLITKLLEN